MAVQWNIKLINMSIKHPAKLFFLLTASVFCLALVACSQDQKNTNIQTNSGVQFEAISFTDWSDKLTQYSPKVVVVDLWAMWCLPCIERFPKMVDLNQKYADKNVAFVSINFDDPEDTEGLQKAENFLKEVGATFDNFYFNENLIDSFEHMGVIALPTVLVYDSAGNEFRRLTNTNPNRQFSGKDIEDVIEKLLVAN